MSGGSTQAWVGGVVGGVVGFYMGGPVGAGYGFAIGFGLGSALTPMDTPEITQHDTGLQAQTSQRGTPIPVIFGARKVPGNLIWYGNFATQSHEQDVSGKGGGSVQGATSYTYSASFAFAICVGEIAQVARIWADKDEIDMNDEGSSFVIYKGTTTQTADSHMSSFLDRNTAYRGVAYVVFYNYNLGSQPRIPNFTFEVYGLGIDEESVTEDISITEMAAVQTNSGYGVDSAVLMSRNRIFFGDNTSYKYSMWGIATGTNSDTLTYLQNVANVNGNRLLYGGEASSFSSKEVGDDGGSYFLGITQSEMFAFATDQYATVHRYNILNDIMEPFAFCLTIATTLYTSFFKAQDCSWRNDCEFLAIAIPNAGGGYGGIKTYGWTAISTPNAHYPYNQAIRETNQTGTESLFGCYSIDWSSTTDNIVALTENRIMVVYNFNLVEQAIRHVDADCDMENPYSPYHFMCKWNSAGDRIAVSHRSVSSRSLTIYKYENVTLTEDCWINVGASGSPGLRDIQWDTDDAHIYGINDDFVIQYIYSKATSTISERAARCNSQFEGAYYCAYDSNTSRIIVGGQQADYLGSYKTKRTIVGSADVSPPLVTKALLTNDFWGGGIDSSYLVNSVFETTQEYCIRNDYLIAPVFRSANSILDGLNNIIGYHDGYITCIDNKIRHEQLEVIDEEIIITDTDEVVGGELGIAKDSERDTVNRIRLAYTNRDNTYTTGIAQRDAFAEQDYSGLRPKEISMDAYTSFDRADKMSQRLLKKWLNRPLNMSMKVGPKLKGKLTPGGVFGIDHTVTGINSMKGRIASISEQPDNILEIEFREEKDFTYNTSLQSPPSNPTSPPVDPYNIRSETEDVQLYMIERTINKIGDTTNIIAGVTSQVSDTSFAGSRIYHSIDDATYSSAKVLNENAISGIVTAVDTSPGYFKSLTVQLNAREQTFVSYSSRDNFTNNNVNFAYWDDRKIRFQTITSQGSLTYLLENILVTEKLNYTTDITGNKILFLTYGNLDYISYDLASPVIRYYKAPSFNFAGIEQDVSSISATAMTIGKETFTLKPVENLGIIVSSFTYDFTVNITPPVTISWRPRSRIEGYGKKGYGIGGYGHALTDDIIGYQIYVNSTNTGVQSETTFTHSLSDVSFSIRQIGNTHQISDPKTIYIS